MNSKTARIIRYSVAGTMFVGGIVGATVTEPVEGIGAPVPAKAVRQTPHNVLDATVNVGGKRMRVTAQSGPHGVYKVQVKRTKGKLPKPLRACEFEDGSSDRDLRWGCTFAGGEHPTHGEFVNLPLNRREGMTVTVYADGTFLV